MRLYLGLLFSLLFIQTNATTINVCADCTTQSIKEGIAQAENGDTVLVESGVYSEFGLFIDKEITVLGVDLPVLDGKNIKDSIFVVHADNVTIGGFRVKNIGMSYTKEYAAIFVSKSKYFTFKDNVFENVFYGFIIQKSKYGLIQNNTISGNAIDETSSGNGIHLWHCQHMRIEQNSVVGLRDGIYLEFVDNSSISNNTSKKKYSLRITLHVFT